MTGWLRVVRREVRHALPVTALFAVVTAAMMWTHPDDWGMRWNALGSYLRSCVIILGPLGVVVGVWWGGRDARDQVGELFASVRRARLAEHTGAVAGLVLAAYLGVLGGALSGAWTIVVTGGYGSLVAVWYVLAVLPTLAAYVVAGYAVGRLVPWRVAAPIAGAAVFVTFGFVIYDAGRFAVVLGMGEIGGVQGLRFDVAGLILAVLTALATCVALVALASHERRPAAARGWLIGLIGGGVALSLAGTATAATAYAGRAHYPRMAHPALACTTDGGPRVCVLREDRPQLARATRQARPVIERAAGVAGGPVRALPELGDSGAVVSRRALPLLGVGTLPFGGIGRNDVHYLPDVFGYFSADRYCHVDDVGLLPDEHDDNSVYSRAGLVAAWLRDERISIQDGPAADRALTRAFIAADDHGRSVYAGRLLAAVRSCDIQRVLATDRVLIDR